MKLIRYIFTIPAFAMGLFVALFVSLKLSSLLSPILCPAVSTTENFCYRYPEADAHPLWLYYFGASLAAILMVALPALVAPDHKTKIAVTYFIIGSVTALSLASGISDLAPVALSAVFSGAITLLMVQRLATNNTTPHTGDML